MRPTRRAVCLFHAFAFGLYTISVTPSAALAQSDHLKQLQSAAAQAGSAPWGHWGGDPARYAAWSNHSNRLIPLYTFGITTEAVAGKNSLYRDADRLTKLYGQLPKNTLNPDAEYFDQTDIYRLQKMAAEAGKKYIILMIFDGTDWQTTQAAAIYRSGKVGYTEGRGTGLYLQDYRGVQTDFGCYVTSPHNEGTRTNVDNQTIANPGGTMRGGYDWKRGGSTAWAAGDYQYLTSKSGDERHAYTDSASSATSMTAGIKTYNDAINMDYLGRPVLTIAHELQEKGYAIGVLTSVPISHATPAAAYSHNVHRDDYQDLTRDLLGVPSISHPAKALPGVDVLLGAGWGERKTTDSPQGRNFVAGNRYLTDADLKAVDAANGGKYQVVQRTSGVPGKKVLMDAADEAIKNQRRLLGYFGAAGTSHLPYQTADGKFDPARNASGTPPLEQYTPADISENPVLADFAVAALNVLSKKSDSFWMMIEAGDVDWANHKNNIDCSVGAVLSGDDAFHAIADWIEANKAWDKTAVLVSADHGHYLVLEKPEALIPPKDAAKTGEQK